VDRARAKLANMSLTERIVAVATDVNSKKDEYGVIESRELASLLGIDDLSCPGEGWHFVWYVPRLSVRDILLLQWNDDFIPELLQQHVTLERFEELRSKIKTLKRNKRKLQRASLDFFTEEEKEKIEQLYMEREAKNIEPWLLAFCTIKAPGDIKATFQADIGDGGESSNLKTPYDERDGNFADLSRSLIVEDRR
jgi:hypothetical protein